MELSRKMNYASRVAVICGSLAAACGDDPANESASRVVSKSVAITGNELVRGDGAQAKVALQVHRRRQSRSTTTLSPTFTALRASQPRLTSNAP